MKKVIKLLGLVLLLQLNLGAKGMAQTNTKNVDVILRKLDDPKLQSALKVKFFQSLSLPEKFELLGLRKHSDLFAKLFAELTKNTAEMEYKEAKALASGLNISIAEPKVNKNNGTKCAKRAALSKKLIQTFGTQISKAVFKIMSLVNIKPNKAVTTKDIHDLLHDLLTKTLSSCSDAEITILTDLANNKTVVSIANKLGKLIDFTLEKVKI